jgi:hypothetical protein
LARQQAKDVPLPTLASVKNSNFFLPIARFSCKGKELSADSTVAKRVWRAQVAALFNLCGKHFKMLNVFVWQLWRRADLSTYLFSSTLVSFDTIFGNH